MTHPIINLDSQGSPEILLQLPNHMLRSFPRDHFIVATRKNEDRLLEKTLDMRAHTLGGSFFPTTDRGAKIETAEESLEGFGDIWLSELVPEFGQLQFHQLAKVGTPENTACEIKFSV
jgi:hypothetical protein